MNDVDDFSVTEPARRLYEEKLKDMLVPSHRGEFIAVEPETGGYVIHPTFRGIFEAARNAFPGKMTYVIRIGFPSGTEISYAHSEE
jgi:hypothetical protein